MKATERWVRDLAELGKYIDPPPLPPTHPNIYYPLAKAPGVSGARSRRFDALKWCVCVSVLCGEREHPSAVAVLSAILYANKVQR